MDEFHGNHKSKTNTDTEKTRKQHKHISKENHHATREKKKKKKQKNQKNNQKTSSKMTVSAYISKVTLNVNGLNTSIKSHKVVDRTKKIKDPSICSPEDTSEL